MKQYKSILVNIIWLIIGGILIGLSVFEKVDSFWSGMGSSLFVIGFINLLRLYRINRNEDYREKLEVELSDERNRFIRNKAWAWTGYIFTILSAILSIFFKIIHQDNLSIYAGFTVLLMIIIFWLSYLFLKRKY